MARARRPEQLSAAAARRAALAAQGFARARPARSGPAALRRVLDHVQLVQLDSVNVLVRAQELPLWARLGDHPRDLLPQAVARRELFEYWGHEASLCPVALHPLLRWRMDAARAGANVWGNVARIARERRGFCDEVLAQIRARGPLAAGELDGGGARPKSGWWEWSDGKRALEYLFWAGALTATRRDGSFERVYDLPERVLPPAILAAPTPTVDEAHRQLLGRAARALGVATAADLADYFRLKRPAARPRLAELVEAGALAPVAVEGWREPAYLDPAAAIPRAVDARALVGPFDPLVWHRDRALRLFGFHYRLEIYTPAPKRRHGYYVLPFVLGDRLVARVDLKADRAAGVLRVHGSFAEPDVATGPAAVALAAELRAMARWLALTDVVAAARGDLARALRAALRASR
ncbi:MAG: YcaQ family DNA glycosylase [Myxococcales bacterium]|nr:YcaQ family DNA glycosylase [Myxococcales bacterium]MBP6842559.1 YcaQ family DNA glycosylase [Kofleriaceae bacterium]